MKIRFFLAALALFAVAASAQAGSATRDTVGLIVFSTGAPIADTSSQLVRNDNGVNMTIHTNSLAPGSATTVWWVIFNHPSKCHNVGGPGLRCGAVDLGNPAVAASVQFATGHVIGGGGVGNFGAYLKEGDTSGCAFGTSLCNGLIDAREADVHLVVRTHGDAVPGFIPEEISSFNGGCLSGEPNVGKCHNVQAAPHEAP